MKKRFPFNLLNNILCIFYILFKITLNKIHSNLIVKLNTKPLKSFLTLETENYVFMKNATKLIQLNLRIKCTLS